MGEVYRASRHQARPRRRAQVLPADMAQDPSGWRAFARRSQGASAARPSQHRHHLSVEECDGVHFLTMPVGGRPPLDRLIPQAAGGAADHRDCRPRWATRWRQRMRRASSMRPEARERHGLERRPGQGPGFRTGEGHSRRQRRRRHADLRPAKPRWAWWMGTPPICSPEQDFGAAARPSY